MSHIKGGKVRHGLGGVAFENETRERLRALGWVVETTSVSGDFGADLIARISGEVIVVQCKDYGSPAGVSAVQEIYFARTHYRASGAIVVARNGFTRAAIRAAQSASVRLFRPEEMRFDSFLDRTARCAGIEREIERQAELAAKRRREIEREIERQAEVAAKFQKDAFYSELWRRYDRSYVRYLRWIRVRLVAISAITFLGFASIIETTISQWSSIATHQNVSKLLVEFISITFFLSLVYRKPRAPDLPLVGRKGAVITCDVCDQPLRVDYGRTGWIRCPRCTSLLRAKT